VHEKNAPKGKPFETRARILFEIMKEPLSRTRLKERLNDVSTKTIDYHIQRAGDSLLNIRIVREENNLLTLNVMNAEDLINILTILKAHKEKGTIIQKSLNMAFVACFLSAFGDRAKPLREETRRDSDAIIFYYRNKTQPNEDVTSRVLKLAERTYGSIDLSFQVHYILKVMGNVRQARECYLVTRSKDYKYLDSSSADEAFKKGFRRADDKPRCQLWDFTNFYSKTRLIPLEAAMMASLFPELVQYFYDKIIFKPIFTGEMTFEVIDREDVKDKEVREALYYLSTLLHYVGNDHFNDDTYNPFESGMILRIIEGVKQAVHESSNIREATNSPIEQFKMEYIRWRLDKLHTELAYLKNEIIEMMEGSSDHRGTNRHFK